MNKYQKELLEKCIITKISDELPLFDDIYITSNEVLIEG